MAHQSLNDAAPAQEFGQFDWDAFAGAEEWPSRNGENPKPPVWRQVGPWMFVFGATASEVYKEEGEDNDEAYENNKLIFPSQAAALAWLNDVPADFNPKKFGFKRIPV